MQASYAHMQPAYERMKAAYARTAAFMQGRMQPACSLHASLVWTRHNMLFLHLLVVCSQDPKFFTASYSSVAIAARFSSCLLCPVYNLSSILLILLGPGMIQVIYLLTHICSWQVAMTAVIAASCSTQGLWYPADLVSMTALWPLWCLVTVFNLWLVGTNLDTCFVR